MNTWSKQTGIFGKSLDLPKPVRPATAIAVKKRTKKGETVTVVEARKNRKPRKRWK